MKTTRTLVIARDEKKGTTDLSSIGFTPNTTLSIFLETLERSTIETLNSILVSDYNEMYLSLNDANIYNIILTDDYLKLSKELRKYAKLNLVRTLDAKIKRYIKQVIEIKSKEA